MKPFLRGAYVARLAEGAADVAAAQRLRHAAFIQGRSVGPRGATGARDACLDADHLDAVCDHMLLEERRTGRLVCCYRLMPLTSGADIESSYSAQFYDLAALRGYPDPMVEMGRFCILPGLRDPDLLRVAWGAMTGYVDARGAKMLFGCSSFEGTEAEAYHDAFALLKARHLAPKRWLPRVKAPRIFPFAKRLRIKRPDMKLALGRMPPLLRSYLIMGGWVSDHAVVDNDLNTLHVFTGLEISRMPPTRARLMRGI